MRITGLEIRTVSIPFKRPYRSSKATVSNCVNVIVRILTDAGIDGWGESAPGVSDPEAPAEAVAATIAKHLAPAVVGLDPRSLPRLHAAMDHAVGNEENAKAAIDIAACDVFGKSLGVPVCTLLGGRCRDRIPINGSIGTGDPGSIRVEADAIVRAGFRTIKLKGSGDPAGDIARVKAAREAVGPSISIRIDPNASYADADTALKAFRAMEAFDLELAEQPLPRRDVEGMARLCRALETPVMADESLFTLKDAVTLLRERAADVFNVKLQKAGGIYRAMQIGHLADGAGIPLMIGARSETGVGQSASVHVAAACATVRHACDLRTPMSLVRDVLRQSLPVEEGEVICPDRPGLGIEIDAAALDEFTTGRQWVR